MLVIPRERWLEGGDAETWVAVWWLSGDAKLMEVVPSSGLAPGTRTSTPAPLQPHTPIADSSCPSRVQTHERLLRYQAGANCPWSVLLWPAPGSLSLVTGQAGSPSPAQAPPCLHPRPQLLEAPASPRAQHAWLAGPLPIRERQMLARPVPHSTTASRPAPFSIMWTLMSAQDTPRLGFQSDC